jgi:lysophosphatidate acyltransferase
MANHQSMLDVLVIGRLMPMQTVIMSKKSLQFTPLGPFMTMSGTIFIDRGNNNRAIQSIDDAVKRMQKEKSSLWMFPEGTRHMSKEPSMLPLKKGGFHMAINAGIPIIPIVTANYWDIYRKGIFNSGVIKVRVLPAIPTSGVAISDVGQLSTRVHDVMLEALRDLSSPSTEKRTPPASQEPSAGSGPLESAADLLAPSTPAQETIEMELQSKGSSSSLASSSVSSAFNRKSSSEKGAETEEDEGMILVGRP